MSTRHHITPKDYGATLENWGFPPMWTWWVDDQIALAFYDNPWESRPFELEFFGEANNNTLTATQLDGLHEVIGKAIECRKALIKQKQRGVE